MLCYTNCMKSRQPTQSSASSPETQAAPKSPGRPHIPQGGVKAARAPGGGNSFALQLLAGIPMPSMGGADQGDGGKGRAEGGGTPLPRDFLGRMEGAFGQSFGNVRVKSGAKAAVPGAKAWTQGETIFMPDGLRPGDPDQERVLTHELSHVVQQRAGERSGAAAPQSAGEADAEKAAEAIEEGKAPTVGVQSSPEVAQHVAPAVVGAVVWGAKAVVATVFDTFLDMAIAAILALPAPGAGSVITSFLINLVPYLGELKKVKKAKKLFEVIGSVAALGKRLSKLNIPGADKLLSKILGDASVLKAQVFEFTDDSLKLAQQTFARLLGSLREMQVAGKLVENGADVLQMGKVIKRGGKIVTDIDVIYKEGAEVIFGQVKAGNAAKLGKASDSWPKFQKQVEETVTAAQSYSNDNGVVTRVVYFVDDASEDALKLFQDLGIRVKGNADFLN